VDIKPPPHDSTSNLPLINPVQLFPQPGKNFLLVAAYGRRVGVKLQPVIIAPAEFPQRFDPSPAARFDVGAGS
jgi:hypothetical protein